ncbi:RagB/SusD family nutrient uptake outer membrane protein [Arcicella aquatica]|uniref:RagB/SusD family nutrient uptake outer membrane protein n=1 Tax=Arcicella aquatica TaxID=217141 RepID=A0ABU5QQZ4_9BACT|nr:RagB/SusD family nutrient uptake outer membrane protein [Arcicella aquatica]MEA5259180.1 RagB/SusD family nutrient uptake outer membrane protein [Arcicella aquatica]
MKRLYNIIAGSLCLVLVSCHTDFLEVKPDSRLAVPASLKDMDALMDNMTVMNTTSVLIMGEIGTDDYYLNETEWNSLTNPYQKNGYVWAKDIYEGQQCPGWNNAYTKVLYSNIVLEGLSKIQPNEKNTEQYNRIRGTALFWRAWQFFQLAQIFCDDYEKENASQKMGIPIRLSSNINQSNARVSIEATYQQIVNDLTETLTLLPALPKEKTRPSKQATLALLARIYLQMKEYALAKQYVNQCLAISDELMDYNKVDSRLSFPFPLYSFGNVEQSLFNVMLEIQVFFSYLKVNPTLLDSYEANDLRFPVYFLKSNNDYTFKGSYNGYDTFNPFPALDELMLIRAECSERLGNHEDALQALNTLLINRYKTGTYQAMTVANTRNILTEILNQRRKSLVFRGVRWSDLRRLRKEMGYTFVRSLGTKKYELAPEHEKLYTWPIPDNVIILGGIPQNVR